MKLDDEIEIYPSQKLIDDYENGKPLEEVLKEVDDDTRLDETEKRLAKYVAEEFYKKWEGENGKKD